MPKVPDEASTPAAPPAPAVLPAPAAAQPVPKPVYVGQFVRRLREASGLTRSELQRQTGVSAAALRNLETGHRLPTAWTLRRLLRAACMTDLPELAAQAGLELNVGAESIAKPITEKHR